MGKTYSCTFQGCDMVFSRKFQLRKHEVTHDHSAPLFYCTKCDFYTLDSRNLGVHIATHTGERPFQCPDMVTVRGASGLLSAARCNHRTHDRSLLTKHRKKKHEYIPRPRASPQRGEAFTFIPYRVPSSSAPRKATSRTTKKSKRVKKSSRTRAAKQGSTASAEHAAQDSSSPSTSQQGANEQEHAASPDAAGSSSVDSSSALSLARTEHALPDAHGQRAYGESPDAISTLAASSSDTISVVPNNGISLDTHGHSADVESSYAAGSSSTMPIALDQDLSINAPLEEATVFDQWSTLFPEDFTAPSVAEAHNPVLNLQMDTFAAGVFGTNIGLDGPGIEGWNESDWNDFYARFNSV